MIQSRTAQKKEGRKMTIFTQLKKALTVSCGWVVALSSDLALHVCSF
jgi:hypothetical protein